MKTKLFLIVALLLAAFTITTAQRKTVTDKLQVTSVKNAKVLGTDDKGNVVVGTLPEIPEGKSAEEICAEQWTSTIKEEIPLLKPLNLDLHHTTELGEGTTYMQLDIFVDTKKYNGETNLTEHRIYMETDVDFTLKSYDGTLQVNYKAGVNDITDYLFNTNSAGGATTEELKDSFLKHKKISLILIFATEIASDNILSIFYGKYTNKRESICSKISNINDKIQTTKEHVEKQVTYQDLTNSGFVGVDFSSIIESADELSFRRVNIIVTDVNVIHQIANKELGLWLTIEKPTQLVFQNIANNKFELYGERLEAGEHDITEYMWNYIYDRRIKILEDRNVAFRLYYTDSNPLVQPKLVFKEKFSIKDKLKENSRNIFNSSGVVKFNKKEDIIDDGIFGRKVELENPRNIFMIGRTSENRDLSNYLPLQNGLFISGMQCLGIPPINMGFINRFSDNSFENTHVMGLGHDGFMYHDFSNKNSRLTLQLNGKFFKYTYNGRTSPALEYSNDSFKVNCLQKTYTFSKDGLQIDLNGNPKTIIDTEGNIPEIYKPKDLLKLNATTLPTLAATDRAIVLDSADNKLKFWDGTTWHNLY